MSEAETKTDTKAESPWETVYQANCESFERVAVPGGWIYRSSQDDGDNGSESMVFVPWISPEDVAKQALMVAEDAACREEAAHGE